MRKLRCPVCNGFGIRPTGDGSWFKCDTCKGLGIIEELEKEKLWKLRGQLLREC